MRRLILRPGAIGDCVLSLPALRHLAVEYTEVWTSSAFVPLVRFAEKVRALSSTGIELVGIGDPTLSAELRATLASFDTIVSWYGANRPEFRDAIQSIGVPCEFLRALPPTGYAGHATTFFNEQVNAPDSNPRIEQLPAQVRNSLVIHPFSGSKRKNWPLESYRALAASLPVNTEWTAGPEEELDQAARFEDLAELAHWLSGAKLYIGNDSGITHLAAALGIPTLALFGPTEPAKWAPRGDNVIVLRSEPIASLAIETVLSAANRLLSWPSTGASSGRSAYARP
ncbi:MAG: glycosyltransferase family 9 protein [Acidobacteriaceae bacterium]|nr:glycosyltransferase family 9 protein [Acidobacteriaceae bacterium]